MFKLEIIALFERDLQKLVSELRLYESEAAVWALKDGISNSAGTLCLHLIGNLNHFIGATLGNTGYVRQRDLEFSTRDVPRDQLISEIEKVTGIVATTIRNIEVEQLYEDFPLEKHGGKVSTMHMLLHLYGHLSYHSGQVNYHRRMM